MTDNFQLTSPRRSRSIKTMSLVLMYVCVAFFFHRQDSSTSKDQNFVFCRRQVHVILPKWQ